MDATPLVKYNASLALLLLEGEMNAQVAQGRQRHIWIDDIKLWTNLDSDKTHRPGKPG